MGYLTNEEKAKLYNDMLFRYERMSEQIRLIKAKSFDVSAEDQKQITILEERMRQLYQDTQRLYLEIKFRPLILGVFLCLCYIN